MFTDKKRDIKFLINLENLRRSLQKAYFFVSTYSQETLGFPLTKVSASKVPAILKKFVLKEAQNSTLEAANLKLYLAARPCLCDIILFNSQLVSKMFFFQAINNNTAKGQP